MSFSNTKIKQLREYNNYSQSYMAEQLQISQSAYAKIENGYTSLTEDRLKKIAEILNIDPNKLLSNDEFVLNIQNNTLNNESSIIREFNSKQNKLYERLLNEKNNSIKRLEDELKFLKMIIEKLK